MIDMAQLDFLTYTAALKSNYEKGVNKLRAILQSPMQANAFATNSGGVAVIFGADPDNPDGNSDALLSMLQVSPYADQALTTWLKDFYNFQTQDDLFGDSKRCKEIGENPFIMQALECSGSALGKWVATTIGQDCSTYNNIAEVLAKNPTTLDDSVVMQHIIGNGEALSVALKDANMRDKLGKWANEKRQGNYRVIKRAIIDEAKFKKSAWAACSGESKTYNGINFATASAESGVPLPCLFICHKAGANGKYSSSSTANVLNVQSGISTGYVRINNADGLYGGAENTSVNVGGRKEERFCVGGVGVHITAGSVYVAGYFYYAL